MERIPLRREDLPDLDIQDDREGWLGWVGMKGEK